MSREIIDKLRIEDYKQKLVLNKPDNIHDFDAINYDTNIKQKSYDLIFAFIFSLNEFTGLLETVISQHLLNPDGYIYFAYPKKGNKQYREYINRDDFFPQVDMDNDGYVNGSHVKFNKMVAFNDVFTAIGLKHLPVRKTTTKPSQCVADYVERIPDLQNHFAGNKTTLQIFNSLTPGYQRDWARYIYSAQTGTTVQKRLTEMEDILAQGYKSKDLYRQKKK